MMKNSLYCLKIDFSYINDYSLSYQMISDEKEGMRRWKFRGIEWMSWGNGKSGLR